MWYNGTKPECEAYNLEVYNGLSSMKLDPFTTSYASIQELEQLEVIIYKRKETEL